MQSILTHHSFVIELNKTLGNKSMQRQNLQKKKLLTLRSKAMEEKPAKHQKLAVNKQ